MNRSASRQEVGGPEFIANSPGKALQTAQGRLGPGKALQTAQGRLGPWKALQTAQGRLGPGKAFKQPREGNTNQTISECKRPIGWHI